MSHVNLDAYFQRIGYAGEWTPTLETLQELHRRHAESIPFENLDSLLRRPVRIDLDSIQRKLVEEQRGGYCFEQNGLFSAVLEAVGFRLTRLAGRVVYMGDPHAFPPRTHMLIRVDVGDESYLADVGFGGMVQTGPLRLAVDVEQSTPHEPFRMIRWENDYLMQASIRGGWVPLYRFTLDPQAPSDYEVGNWYVSTYPESLFVNHLMASRPAPGVRYALRNNELAIHHLGGNTERRTLRTAEEVRAALRELMQIKLPEGAELDTLLERLANSPSY
ncbi:arylamine N-acetyltransferase family protein [Lacipirellula sp.]|uniref:arylamine N-acetyltransferase family protein n=1 Tax=Lacipirellula sp. TaxID=2691419 RepID=UPI003D112D2B